MGALATLKELVDWIMLIPKLVKINEKQRQEIRDVVGGIGDELMRGLALVAQRIEGGKRIAISNEKGKEKELEEYISDSQLKLHESFSEFKVCRGLREKRDHFEQLFHPARASVRTENVDKVTYLLAELESDERMIFDEVGSIFDDLRKASSSSTKKYINTADVSLKQIKKRKSRVRRLVRKVHDKL